MPDIGVPELIIIAVIVLLLFGPGKAADLGGSLGKGIREFRKATREDDGPASQPAIMASATSPSPSGDAGASVSANGTGAVKPDGPSGGRFCTECETTTGEGQKFCTNCGAALAAQVG
jgi:sec-independent protein translocase protein TatA